MTARVVDLRGVVVPRPGVPPDVWEVAMQLHDLARQLALRSGEWAHVCRRAEAILLQVAGPVPVPAPPERPSSAWRAPCRATHGDDLDFLAACGVEVVE